MTGLAVILTGLHHALVGGDPTAPAKIFSLSYKPLCRYLAYRIASLQQEEISDAVEDALMDYLTDPRIYDPTKASLWVFLCAVAHNHARTARRTAARRIKHDKEREQIFELSQPSANNGRGNADEIVLARELIKLHLGDLAANEKEREVLELICCDVRGTSEYARVLGLDMAHPATVAEVKKMKDKVKARLKKLGDTVDD